MREHVDLKGGWRAGIRLPPRNSQAHRGLRIGDVGETCAVSGRSQKVERILDQLHRAAKEQDEVSVGDVVEVLGDRGWGPFVFVPAVIEISPIGGIPGVPTFLACIIAIFAVQIALGREHIWLPGIIERRAVSGDRLRKAVVRMRPVGRWLDRWFRGRLSTLTTGAMKRVAAGLILLLCLSVPPLELFPFASTAPMAAIAAFGLALMFCDGLLMALGLALAAGAVAAALWFAIGGG